MNRYIHYLIRNPSKQRGLVYPSEVQYPFYAARGDFYIIGKQNEVLRNIYSFHAVHRNELIVIDLRKERELSTNLLYIASHNIAGKFHFFAERLRNSIAYIGDTPYLRDRFALYRVRSLELKQLEFACLKHNFYFVGFSNSIA